MKTTAPADLMSHLAAAREEVAEAAARSRALRKQMQAEDLAQAARAQQQRGADGEAGALGDDAEAMRRRALDVKA